MDKKNKPLNPNHALAASSALTSAASAASGADIHRSLAKELCSLIPKLDAEGLAFLLKQARIHLYNMQVDELNRAAQAANDASARSNILSAQKKSMIDNFKVDSTGAGYYLRYAGGGFIFSKSEMNTLARIVNNRASVPEITEMLYIWLERERRDVLMDIPIMDKHDNKLKKLAAAIRKIA